MQNILGKLVPYVLTFVPIFMAVNAFGNIPLYLSMSEGMKSSDRSKVINNSILVASIIAILFMFLGNIILKYMNVTVQDFRIAGGIMLLVLSIHLLLPGEDKRGHPNVDVGIFPLGTPLITGPAVLTTVLILRGAYGWLPTAVSIILNMLFMWFVLLKADLFIKVLGKGGTRALAKVSDIFLAAIAVMMIRNGLLEIIIAVFFNPAVKK
ncbi:MAG: MarC family protein [Candidatus Omnitrophota bacterium]